MIVTIDALKEAIERDATEHNLKSIAELFVSAMTDWPGYNQVNIIDFINEFEDYFGSPVTIEKIASRPFDASKKNAWRQEAGASIIEMLNLSESQFNGQSFEQIVKSIYFYYSQE